MSNGYHTFSVDCGNEIGTIKALNGVNLGPIVMNGFMDLSEWMKPLRFPHVRLHDCPYSVSGTVDVHYLFPRFDADVDDPANYDFAITDDYIQSILDLGSGIVFRLGESIEHHTRNKYHVHPPADNERWARICVNIIRHYNEGWAGGFHHGIRYWEIWNEPWVRPQCWTGTDEQWFDLYAAAARAIRAHDPSLKIGGPTADGTWPNAFTAKFLDFVGKHDLPLDFFSWHKYADHPRHVMDYAAFIRSELDRRGLNKTEIHLNEWNYHPGDDWSWKHDVPNWGKDVFTEMSSHAGAAFISTVLTGLQDQAIDVGNFYWSNPGWWGIFNWWGGPHKTYYAFLAFARLLETPRRLSTQGTDIASGNAILAAAREGGGEVRLLISRFRAAGDRICVSLENLPWQGETEYETAIIDETRSLEVTHRGVLSHGEFFKDKQGPRIVQKLPAHAVMLVTLRPVKKA